MVGKGFRDEFRKGDELIIKKYQAIFKPGNQSVRDVAEDTNTR